MTGRNEIAQEIRLLAQKESKLAEELEKQATEIRDYWRSVSPVDSGEYAASVQVAKTRWTVNGMPGVSVKATNWKSHWIEFGTGEPGPTPAFAPRAKTATKFGSDEKRAEPKEYQR